MTKTILIAVVILGFGLTIFFVSKSFASTCGTGYVFDKISNKCIPKCGKSQIYDRSKGRCRQDCDQNQIWSEKEERCEDLCSGNGGWSSQEKKCLCDPGWVGKNCSYSRDTTCNKNGDPKEDGSCSCDRLWTGSDCSTKNIPSVPSTVTDPSTYSNPSGENNCNDVVVCRYPLDYPDVSFSDFSCKHGSYAGKTDELPDGCVKLEGTPWAYGPDCTFTSSSSEGNESVHIQQNYCSSEGGTLSVSGASNYQQFNGHYNPYEKGGGVVIGMKK